MKLVHVVAALCALLAGTVALVALKGGKVHRRSGMVFVYAMLLMSGTGAVMAALQPNLANLMGGTLTFYLVLTGRLAVRRPAAEFHRIDLAALVMGLSITVLGFGLAFAAVGSRTGASGGVPTPVYVMFATVALLGTVGDLRLMAAGRLEGTRRLARHLWRMCFAFWIATASFFLGPPRRLPPFLRHSPLRPVPVLLVLVVMFYWLVRVSRSRRPPALA